MPKKMLSCLKSNGNSIYSWIVYPFETVRGHQAIGERKKHDYSVRLKCIELDCLLTPVWILKWNEWITPKWFISFIRCEIKEEWIRMAWSVFRWMNSFSPPHEALSGKLVLFWVKFTERVVICWNQRKQNRFSLRHTHSRSCTRTHTHRHACMHGTVELHSVYSIFQIRMLIWVKTSISSYAYTCVGKWIIQLDCCLSIARCSCCCCHCRCRYCCCCRSFVCHRLRRFT